MRRSALAALALVLGGVAGCGGGAKIVPVSGVVKLNGKPYANAVVSFQPVGSKDNPNPGRGSTAVTDAEGKFTLRYDGTSDGALVGKHRVRIFTQLGAEIPDTEGDPAAADEAAKKRAKKKMTMSTVELIPPEWNENSQKEFDVPAGGTAEAVFEITNPKVKN
ncbi:MAG: DUF4198 domain-containing protein [Planctomycetes bacterium]|nr:DUF4198 domain-containing protein [Planctomycetota bacterium]